MTSKTYKVSINRFYDKALGAPVMDVTVTDELRALLGEFAVMGKKAGLRATVYVKTAETTDDGELKVSSLHDRYAVRSILVSSVNQRAGWTGIMDLLFTPDVLKTGTCRVILTGNSVFTQAERGLEQLRTLIQEAETLMQERSVGITFKVEA
jgi:hypothetical protein